MKDILILNSNRGDRKKVLVFREKYLYDEIEEYIEENLDSKQINYNLERYTLNGDGEHLKLYFDDVWDDNLKEYSNEKIKRALKNYYNVRHPIGP